MLLGQWIGKAYSRLTCRNDREVILTPSDFNAKTEATYNAQRTLKGQGRIVISECGHDPKGRMRHFGYNGDWPMDEEELRKMNKKISLDGEEGMHLS